MQQLTYRWASWSETCSLLCVVCTISQIIPCVKTRARGRLIQVEDIERSLWTLSLSPSPWLHSCPCAFHESENLDCNRPAMSGIPALLTGRSSNHLDFPEFIRKQRGLPNALKLDHNCEHMYLISSLSNSRARSAGSSTKQDIVHCSDNQLK